MLVEGNEPEQLNEVVAFLGCAQSVGQHEPAVLRIPQENAAEL